FVDGLDGEDPEAGTVMAGIIGLGRSLGLVMVAEGIDTEEQLLKLRSLGGDLAAKATTSPAHSQPRLSHRF
ncbi:MAG TPA: EAL domain-containing protein, partial [Rubrobacteraceae bacterium]|nr:EAL domain-containing protein [Rubrobacteraceae bacterium]